jgi:hypothetical protein
MIRLDLGATPFAPLSAHLLDLLHELDDFLALLTEIFPS